MLFRSDEVAVQAFLAGALRFTDIPRVIEEVLATAPAEELTREGIGQADEEARALATELVARLAGRATAG